MREYDDDSNIQHYAPVLRRIIILVAVITAVPVMLWTITAFMHTYIAQPTIPAPRPLAAATAAAAPTSPAADTATTNPPTLAAAPSQPAPQSPTPEQPMTAGATGYATAPAIMPRRMSKSPLPPLFRRHRPPRLRLRRLQPRLRCRQRRRPAFSRTRHSSHSNSRPHRTRQMMPMPCRRRIRSPARFPCRAIVRACWRSPTPPYRCRAPVRAPRPNRRPRRPTRRRPATIPASGTRGVELLDRGRCDAKRAHS